MVMRDGLRVGLVMSTHLINSSMPTAPPKHPGYFEDIFLKGASFGKTAPPKLPDNFKDIFLKGASFGKTAPPKLPDNFEDIFLKYASFGKKIDREKSIGTQPTNFLEFFSDSVLYH